MIGKNEVGERNVYILQDRIDGRTLEDEPYSDEAARELKIFLIRSLDFYLSNFPDGINEKFEALHPDLKGANFMFGRNTKRGEEEPRLYFVDTYPMNRSNYAEFLKGYLVRTRDKYFPQQWRPVLEEFYQLAVEKIKTRFGPID
ncbi:MAG: hypothetical protein Q8P83_00750 [bacterium]|nr:hypothetical protein [bacterium]